MTAIASVNPDLFAKIRDSAQMQMLHLSRQAEVLPYFRELDGPAGPVVRMEGAERIMLGSNNYLGLTEDRRVLAGALRGGRIRERQADDGAQLRRPGAPHRGAA